MRKIECACGISHQIYSWPSVEIEQNGVKMMERHLTCLCKREIVVRTAPKYEEDAEPEEGEKTATVASFAEISRQFGVLKEAEPYNKPPSDTLDEEEGEAPIKTIINLGGNDKELLVTLVKNYGLWFKQGKPLKGKKFNPEQETFFALAERIARDSAAPLSEEECRMCKMSLSERNVFKIYNTFIVEEVETLRTELQKLGVF